MSTTSKSPAKDVVTYLESQGKTGIYLNFQPDTPAAVIVVNDSTGLPSDKAHGSRNIAFELPRVQIVVRDANNTTAYNNAYAIHQLLDGLGVQTLNSNSYDYFECLQLPSKLGQDESARFLYGFNVQITRKPA